jgi:hypothetical protein
MRTAWIGLLVLGCSASLPAELSPPDDPGERVTWWVARAKAACILYTGEQADVLAVCAALSPPAPAETVTPGPVPTGSGEGNGVLHVPEDAGAP